MLKTNGPEMAAPRAAARSGASKFLGIFLLGCAIFGLAGCPQGNQDFNAGKKAEAIEDYDTAVVHYTRALQADPTNAEYKLKLYRMRFEAGQYHVEQGEKISQKGDLQMALAEFQKATMIDPSSPIAQQQLQNTLNAIAAKSAAARVPAAASTDEESKMMSGPPELKPLSHDPINLAMTNDTKMIFDTLAKLAGLSVIYDPDLTTRRIPVNLTNVTIEEALDIVSLQAKTFWKPVTSNTIFIAPDQVQKHRDYDEEIMETIYLKNTILPQDLTEIINSLRQLLGLTRLQQSNSQNAIIIRDTPDRVMLAKKIIDDLDKPKAEVEIQFAVLRASRNRMRDLGINPGSAAATLSFSPPTSTTNTSTSSTSTTGTTSTTTSLPLSQLRGLSTADYAITLPSATATALLTDSQTRIIDNPTIRIVDGSDAKLNIGERIPYATGSFQAGVGVGATGTGGSLVNPLVNTQFQYQQVGVIVDVTPRIHVEDREISLKMSIEVSSVAGTQSIGGVNQPIISSDKIENDVRLQDGEVNMLGGLDELSYTKSATGFPGVMQIPLLRYLGSDNQVSTEDQEVVLVVIPHIIRMPNITAENLRSLASGTDTTPAIHLESEVMSPPAPTSTGGAAATASGPAPQTGSARLGFEPASVSIKPGETTTIGVVVQNAQDLYSIPMLLQYDPKVLSVEDVRQGEFLSGTAQPNSPVQLVQHVDKDRGQVIVSATRMPNTPGVSGSGTIFGVVVRGVAPGTATLSILQVTARDSQQRPLQLTTGEATVKVQP